MKAKLRKWYRVDVVGLDNTLLVKKVETDNWVIFNEGTCDFDIAHDDEMYEEDDITNWRECTVMPSMMVVEHISA
jgi:hypothetical protein